MIDSHAAIDDDTLLARFGVIEIRTEAGYETRVGPRRCLLRLARLNGSHPRRVNAHATTKRGAMTSCAPVATANCIASARRGQLTVGDYNMGSGMPE
jgi:hypothetical protein